MAASRNRKSSGRGGGLSLFNGSSRASGREVKREVVATIAAPVDVLETQIAALRAFHGTGRSAFSAAGWAGTDVSASNCSWISPRSRSASAFWGSVCRTSARLARASRKWPVATKARARVNASSPLRGNTRPASRTVVEATTRTGAVCHGSIERQSSGPHIAAEYAPEAATTRTNRRVMESADQSAGDSAAAARRPASRHDVRRTVARRRRLRDGPADPEPPALRRPARRPRSRPAPGAGLRRRRPA